MLMTTRKLFICVSPGVDRSRVRVACPACIAVVLIGVAGLSANARDVLPGPIEADVLRVVDGDTFEVEADIWPGQKINTMVRLEAVDTPELRGRCSEEKALAQKARAAPGPCSTVRWCVFSTSGSASTPIAWSPVWRWPTAGTWVRSCSPKVWPGPWKAEPVAPGASEPPHPYRARF